MDLGDWGHGVLSASEGRQGCCFSLMFQSCKWERGRGMLEAWLVLCLLSRLRHPLLPAQEDVALRQLSSPIPGLGECPSWLPQLSRSPGLSVSKAVLPGLHGGSMVAIRIQPGLTKVWWSQIKFISIKWFLSWERRKEPQIKYLWFSSKRGNAWEESWPVPLDKCAG